MKTLYAFPGELNREQIDSAVEVLTGNPVPYFGAAGEETWKTFVEYKNGHTILYAPDGYEEDPDDGSEALKLNRACE